MNKAVVVAALIVLLASSAAQAADKPVVGEVKTQMATAISDITRFLRHWVPEMAQEDRQTVNRLNKTDQDWCGCGHRDEPEEPLIAEAVK